MKTRKPDAKKKLTAYAHFVHFQTPTNHFNPGSILQAHYGQRGQDHLFILLTANALDINYLITFALGRIASRTVLSIARLLCTDF